MTEQKSAWAKNLARINEWCGNLCAFLVLFLVLLISYDVTMRYFFQSGSVALQELQWHLFALIFLLGAGYTQKHDGHVRVDVLYRSTRLSDRTRTRINLFGTIFFLIPFCLLLIYSSWPFIHNAYVINETSPDPGGLAHRWLLKAMIPFGFFLLLLQGLANVLENLEKLKNSPASQTGKQA